MGNANNAESRNRASSTLIRRRAERFPVRSAPFSATWLAERQTVNGAGMLVNISTGGFAARMLEAPSQGRLLHARLALNSAVGEAIRPIEADARVCGRVRVRSLDGMTSAWLVHFAIESIHPVDEKLMAQAIGTLKTAR